MRVRSKKLLSGASVLAVMAAFGAVSPALAADTVSGPATYNPYVNGQPDSVTFNLDATVRADATTNDSFFNGKSMTAAGANLTVNDSFLIGDIVNESFMTSGANAIDILNDAQIGGQIFNAGSIFATGVGISILDDSTVAQGIENTGSITGTTGILLGDDSEIFGGITNTGYIAGAIGINLNEADAELRDGIENDGANSTIVGFTTAAVAVSAGTLTGGISNDGLIQGQGAAEGILITGGTISGGITNNTGGVIEVTGTGNSAIRIAGGIFNGDVTNSGRIFGDTTSSLGVVITGATVFTGNVVNNSNALISASSTALLIDNATFDGNVTNSGQIVSASTDAVVLSAADFNGSFTNNASGVVTGANTGVYMDGAAFDGNVTNAGAITGQTGNGVFIGTTAFTGNVSNSGDINATAVAGNALVVDLGTTLTGNVTNAAGGKITAGNIGVLIAGTVTGTLANDGTIDPVTGISVTGRVLGGITNSGTILATANAINLTGADTATIVTQSGGLIQGNNGAVTNALNLANTFADRFNGNGGAVDGNIVGGVAEGDDVVMAPSGAGTFAYLRGSATNIDEFNMTGSGTALLGSSARGANGAGVAIGAASMTHGGEGTLYIDDDTTVTLTGAYTQTDGTLEFQLTSSTAPADFGHINAATAALGGRIAAYVQGSTFASVGGNTFTYQNVITGTTAGTFTNAGTIDVNSIFFEGQAIVNAADVDIVLTRLSFADALVLPGLSQNEQAIGGALDTIYNGGAFGSDFEDLYNYLLSLPAGSETAVAHIYDELAGAEHADIQEVGLRASHAFNDVIGERMDDMKSAGHQSMASLGLRRYADAGTAATDASPVASSGMRGSMGVSVWGRGYGAWTESDGDAEAAAYDQDTGGFAGGVDFAVGNNWNVGGALGWSSTSVDFATPGDTGDVDSFQLAAYAAFESGHFYGDAVASLAFHDITTTRQLDLGFTTEIANAAYNANTWGLHGEVGAVFDAGRIDIQPFAGLAYLSNSTDAFAESGAGDFGLLVADSDADSLASTLGVRFSGSWQAGGVRLIPDAEIAWRHEFLDNRQTFAAAFIEDPSTQFQIVSSALSDDSVVASAGLGAQVSKNLVLFVDYNGLYNSSANTHAASAGLRATW